MSEHTEVGHGEGGNRTTLMIWGSLLLLTLLEVLLGYIQLAVAMMLTILMGISLIKAALIMAYFMHLKFERMSLILTVIPATVVCLCLLLIIFPDSFRLSEMGLR